MSASDQPPALTPEQSARLKRRQALKASVQMGLLLYCAPKILHSEAVYAQATPSPGPPPTPPANTVPAGGGGNSFVPLVPILALPLLGGIGSGTAAGIPPAAVPTIFGVPIAGTGTAPLLGRADTPVPTPRGVLGPRPRAVLGPTPFGRGRRARGGRTRRAIRGLG
ncbi:hypothetical protein [Gloeobacter kilaueensis]|uniref:Uncharacterized protein n=1 Tax=Gloeobacter kilaueensis (strain ATCC BAA-2537 / CCAP 1431/1 / ULC 316 / JS1) TaxID=1183438 RepID=U5QJ23_GLOK1|nr:hypothetical protein [Gloeobacter kilaueensis]AGY57685.1 hypothetical protein GKIL_1439 [Gloeobacter kilaueensis JS1]